MLERRTRLSSYDFRENLSFNFIVCLVGLQLKKTKFQMAFEQRVGYTRINLRVVNGQWSNRMEFAVLSKLPAL